MSSNNKFMVYGPAGTLKRMPPALLDEYKPKYFYTYLTEDEKTRILVAVYEEYEKQINASITLTCIIESTPKHNRFELISTGGRMGFRGSSLTDQKTIEQEVTDFILDFSKRYGLTVQEVNPEEQENES